MRDRRRTELIIAAYALLALLVIPVYPHFPSPNEFTRWLLVASVVEHGSIEVSDVLPVIGSRLEDLAVVNGRVYSNKAPGLAIVSAPGYLVSRPLTGPPSQANLRTVLYAMRLFGATVPFILLLMVFARAARAFEVEERQITRCVTALAFATPLFAYGLLLFSHALVAACLFAAWSLIYARREVSFAGAATAGALIGLATISEFPSAVAGAFLLMPLLARRRFRLFFGAVLGGLPFAAILGAYQKAAFGSIFRLPYQFEKIEQYREAAHAGFFGIQVPSVTRLSAILFDPSKGLFLFSPVLVLACVAFGSAFRRLPRDTFFTLLAAPVSLLLVYAGYENWHGGWTVSARYVLAGVPFFVATLLFVRWSWVTSLLVGWSVLAVVLTSLIFPFIPGAFAVPWGSFALPLLAKGLVVPNAFHFISTAAALAVPFLIPAVAVAFSLKPRQLAWAALGAAIALGAGLFFAHSAEPVTVLQRAYIEEVYFEQEQAMSRAFPDAILPPSLVRRRDVELRQPPLPWRF